MQNAESLKNPSPFSVLPICLDARDRQFLYDRINKRVDIMIENGLVEESMAFIRNQYQKDLENGTVK